MFSGDDVQERYNTTTGTWSSLGTKMATIYTEYMAVKVVKQRFIFTFGGWKHNTTQNNDVEQF
jgi:hypothetical protein